MPLTANHSDPEMHLMTTNSCKGGWENTTFPKTILEEEDSYFLLLLLDSQLGPLSQGRSMQENIQTDLAELTATKKPS